MRIDPCPGCGEYVDIASDHKPGCTREANVAKTMSQVILAVSRLDLHDSLALARELESAGYGLVADAKREALLHAAEALRLQPPKLQAQYVGALLAYATEPWRLETKPEEAGNDDQ